ncbi:hypothetical protein EXIGLDRAFT_655387 [Exidia glandulosa HHB12029]|uniref:PH domain-containing protein n=1 Tax=Exidia glandulosa HHB12029 TaxID=1314781 RepID=A0A165DBN2_EXIGL|nr:hypothetical protein EXIGLDRAFT_655387 [Exidia glandulosa HHB12029]
MSTASPHHRSRRSPTPMAAGATKASSPDPIKDAILTASGTGWSPLRIAKRDSPLKTDSPPTSHAGPQRGKQGLGRRQSSSYNHVRTSNLVSNSPFKAGGNDGSGPIGAKYRPSPQYKGLDGLRQPSRLATGRKASGEQRRVSAERRPKSYENANPSNNGTPRRPSKTLQKSEQRAPLIPVQHEQAPAPEAAMDVDRDAEPPAADIPRPATPPRSAVPDSLHGRKSKPIPPLSASRIPVPTGAVVSQSPKSNLVSKRLLGPRSISGSSQDSTGSKRRRRRKTVTFDPRCDVVEFSADEEDEDDMDEDYDDYGHDEDEDDYMETDDAQDDNHMRNNDLDGFVQSLVDQDMPGTPQTESDFPVERAEDTEDGVPYGRSHHAERQRDHRQSLTLSLDSHYDIDSSRQPTSSADISLSSVDLTSAMGDDHTPTMEVEDGIPYGRSHHVQRARAAHELEHAEEREAEALPGSPSPGRTLKESTYDEHLLPTADLPHPSSAERVYTLDDDPFAIPGDFNLLAESGGTGSVRSPRISREEVMRRLERKRAGGSDELEATPKASTPTRRADKPLPIAPGPPLIAIPRFDGDVSFSDSVNFDDYDEEEKEQEQEKMKPAPVLGKVSALDRLMLGVEREMKVIERSPDMSSVGMSTPALDILSSTEEESSFEPSTPMTPASFGPTAATESGAEADGEDDHDREGEKTLLSATFSSSHDMEVDDSPDMSSRNGGMLSLPEPVTWSAGRQNKSSNGSTRSTRSNASTGSKIAQRAASIRQKKRERRESEGHTRPRRSLSVADAEDLGMTVDAAVAELESVLSLPASQETMVETADIPLSESIEHELRKRLPETRKYRMRETPSVIYAADEKVSTVGAAGDIDAGKAWKTIRRPSDMNEYARQIRELRAQEKPGKSFGKVFVRVVGIRGLKVPVPNQPTFFSCTLNNGIHFVTTPECRLAKDCKVDQEFELIEHPKLEFTLTIKVRRDAHLQATPAPKPILPPPPPPAASTGSHSKVSGMLAFFGGGSPRKAHKASRSASPALPPAPTQSSVVPEGLARHLKTDGTLGRVFVSFADIAKHCDTKLFETGFQLVGTRPGGGGDAVVLGELVLQMFRLPPLTGIPTSDMPQSLEECHRGLRHVNWHKATYFEGTLTQNGGDCSSWRRRQFRVVGGTLVAYNDVTKKITTKIDLKHAVAVQDDDNDAATLSRRRDSADALFQVERSFRVKFDTGEDICFFADSEEEKEQWLEVLKALVGHIPPNPLWAELVWQRQQEAAQKAQAQASGSTSSVATEAVRRAR